MMPTWTFVVIGLAVFVIQARAQVALELQHLLEGEEEVCKDGEKTYKIGETWRESDSCTKKSCSRHSAPRTMVVQYAGCGMIMPSTSKCHVTKPDLSKPFPQCCPVVSCT